MDKEYYKEYYRSEREHWFFRGRADILMTHVKDLVSTIPASGEGLKILNIGVATGRTSELLNEFGTVKSVEFDDDCFAFTKENVPNIDLEQGSILDLQYEDNSYDLVCAFDVVEHVEDDQLAVIEMKRVCKEGGAVMLSVPAFMSLWSHHDVVNHHFRRYKVSEIKKLFKDDSAIIYASYFNFWLFPMAYIFRKLNNLFQISKSEENTGSDLAISEGSEWSSNIFYRIFSSEKYFTKRKVNLPFGVSILASWRK